MFEREDNMFLVDFPLFDLWRADDPQAQGPTTNSQAKLKGQPLSGNLILVSHIPLAYFSYNSNF